MDSPSSYRGTDQQSGEGDVLKSGYITGGFVPVKTKRTYYAILCERVLELHDKEKDFRKKKAPRHFIELSNTFNIHDDHMDAKLKQCMCWMGVEDTFCLRAENTKATTEWYLAIFQAVKISRTLTLCRPVTIDEFFSYAWDVEVVSQPKFKKPMIKEAENLPSITETGHMHAGLRRLCFYPHTIILCNRKIEPTTNNVVTSNVPPFDKNEYQEIQRTVCAFFGVHERYFIIKLGRAAPSGSCTIWVQCETEEVAVTVFRKLNQLIDRERERKKNINAGDISNALTSLQAQILRGSHRDRSHTQPTNMRNHSTGQKLCSPSGSTTMIGRKSSAASMSGRCNTMGSPAKQISNNMNPVWGVFNVGPRRSSNSSTTQQAMIVEEPADYSPMTIPATKPEELVIPTKAEEESNEDSGGTLRLENEEVVMTERRPTGLSERKILDSDTDDRSSVGGISGISGHSVPSTASADIEENYAPMELGGGHWETLSNNLRVNITQFGPLDDNKYVSDSSDSCYSSMAANSSMTTSMTANTPRAYSFGGRPQLKHVVTTINEQGLDTGECLTSTLVLPLDDPRKRSYSLGSKNFITRPFQHLAKRFASTQGRQQRHSQTSASGASLASSGGSSFGPSSSSSNHLASSTECDETRNRSGSFGSGRSTPYTKRTAGGEEQNEHLMEMDFSARSCSSSMASIDSPSTRSRTSSFGYPTRKDEFFTGPSLIRLEDLQLQERLKDKLKDDVPEATVVSQPKEAPVLPPIVPIVPTYQQENYIPTGFAAIEESDSESSRRGSRLSLNQPVETPPKTSSSTGTIKPHDYDDDYAVMDLHPPMGKSARSAISPLAKRNSHKNSPTASPSSSRTPQDTRPDRSASSPVREVLIPPVGIPKRCSVPSMRSDSKDDSSLNYASLQIHDDSIKPCSVPKESFLTSPSVNRTRSQSGLVYICDTPTDYATVKPL